MRIVYLKMENQERAYLYKEWSDISDFILLITSKTTWSAFCK